MRAAIFIDGGYFLSRLKDEDAAIDIDYSGLADYLLAPLRRQMPVDLMRCYFYHCPPWTPENPSDADVRRLEAHRIFVEELESNDRWQVRLGKLARRWDGKEEYFEQKRVDVMFSVNLVRHAAAGHIQHAVLLAGDSDFIPAVAAAKESGVTVSLWGGAPKTIHHDLAWISDERHHLVWRAIERTTPAKARLEPKRKPVSAPAKPAGTARRRRR